MFSNDIVIKLWFGGDCNAYLSRSGEGTPLQDEDYYGTYRWTGNYIWRPYYCSEWCINTRVKAFYHAVKEASVAVICNVGFVKGTNNIDN